MRKWLTLLGIYLVLASVSGLAQNSTIDSLKAVVDTSTDDSLKVDNLITLSQRVSNSDRQKAINYAVQARDLADSVGYKFGLANALKYIGINYYALSKYQETLDYWINL